MEGKLQVQYVRMVDEGRRAGMCGAKVADMTWVGREGHGGIWLHGLARLGTQIFIRMHWSNGLGWHTPTQQEIHGVYVLNSSIMEGKMH